MKTRCHKADVMKVGRATWVCSECGEDVSLEYVLYQQAKEEL